MIEDLLLSHIKKKYDWQKTYKSVKIGADYCHAWDDYYESCNPADGIPIDILRDSEELKNHILELIKDKDK